MMTLDLPVRNVRPNPNQPRKRFPEEHIKNLAASIRQKGLLQPISVRPVARSQYEIVAGECRWRAHKLLGLETIRCEVDKMTDREMRQRAVIENVVRRDMNPMEEANAFQALLDDGLSFDELIAETGLGDALIKNRLALLKLTPEIQTLVGAGQITASTAGAIAWVPAHRQAQMVRDISAGKLRTAEDARHAAIAIRDAEAQGDAFADIPRASAKDVAAVRGIEAKVEQVMALVQAGFREGECIAAKRVSPDKVLKIAEQLALIRKHVLAMEHDLRRVAVQSSMQLEMA